MRWFGPSWGAPVNESCEEADTPDWPCLACGGTFGEGDRGVVTPYVGDPEGRGRAAYHLRCFLQNLGLEDRPGARPED